MLNVSRVNHNGHSPGRGSCVSKPPIILQDILCSLRRFLADVVGDNDLAGRSPEFICSPQDLLDLSFG